MSYQEQFNKYIEAVESTLKELLPVETHPPAKLHEAMHYAVFSGGKRFRPVLCLLACEACGGEVQDAVLPAASLELIHAYSLVHDDLPALDNDNFRRGQMTVHRRYGEALAILTGDSLLTLAFEVLSGFRPASRAVALLAEISTSSGTYGMIGGQAADMESGEKDLDLPTLDFINVHKTGKLIRAGAVAGAIAAGADKKRKTIMTRYGEFLGLAFQSIDDLHDGDGYLKVMKPRFLKEQTRDLIAKAKREVRPMGKNASMLIKLADSLLDRMSKEAHTNVPVD